MTEEIVIKHWEKMKAIIEACKEIEMLYDTRHAITIGIEKTIQRTRRTPVENALYRIEAKKAELKQDIDSYYKEHEEIEKWLSESVQDPIMKNIIRMKFLTGKSWADVAAVVYGDYKCADIARIYYRRHKAAIYES